MAKKKKAKLDGKGLALVGLSVLGAVLSVVGLFLPWFASKAITGDTQYIGLFGDGLNDLDEFLADLDSFFPVGTVQAFGIIAAVVAVIAALAIILKAFGIVKVGFIPKLLVSAAAIVFGILALVFSFTYVGNFADLGAVVTVSAAVGTFFTGIGGIVAGGALLLK